MRRPVAGECEAYYFKYIDQVPDGDVFQLLARNIEASGLYLAGIPAEREEFRYAPEKWTIRQVVLHMLDVERVFGYRACCIGRGVTEKINSMDQDAWVAVADVSGRSLASLIAEFRHLRAANLEMFRGFTPADWERTGHASGFQFTVSVFPWILAGHEIHHMRVLRERYQ